MKNKNKREAFDVLDALGAPVFDRDANSFYVDLEEGSSEPGVVWGDFYELGYPWVNPKLEEVVAKHGGFVEWKNPGVLWVGGFDDA
jgi:hypothetical protein|tara:strand:+ start:7051 stop:7308 length:258 start_codon:yes stop_codon:yes gene_type:complete